MPTTIEVFCSGETSEHPRWVFGSFYPEGADTDSLKWYESVTESQSLDGHVTEWLAGDAWVSQRAGEPNFDTDQLGEARRKYKFGPCPKCGLRVPDWRAERLDPIFTGLALAGIGSISLLLLRARLN